MAEEPKPAPDPKPDPVLDPIIENVEFMKQELLAYRNFIREWNRAQEMQSTTTFNEQSRKIRLMAAKQAMGWNPHIFDDLPIPGAQITKNEENHFHAADKTSGNGFGLLGKLAIGGLIGLGGAGLGVGGMLLGNLLSKPTPAQVQEQKDVATQIFEKGPDGQWKKVTP